MSVCSTVLRVEDEKTVVVTAVFLQNYIICHLCLGQGETGPIPSVEHTIPHDNLITPV